MVLMNSISTILTLILLFPMLSVADNGLFYLQRIGSSCVETNVALSTDNIASPNCFTFNWNQVSNMTTTYSTYIDPNTNQTFYAQLAALTVLGMIDYNLTYECPPSGYNGVGPGCTVPPNTQLAILHVNLQDGKLYAIDIILPGRPFPSIQTLQDNQPPFGRARHVFPLGLTIQASGYFQICKTNVSNQCPNQNNNTRKLPYPLPSNYASGNFGSQALGLVTSSTWLMDDLNQLLIVTAGIYYYYFNRTGFFYYDRSARTCTWLPTCNYECEVYNYNSRFLDYAGEWIVMNKWGVNQMQPKMVDAWIGNAIDAAGVFPIIMYTDKSTGHYLGLDKLDLTPSSKMGAMYWYTNDRSTVPATDILSFHPNVMEAGCVSNTTIWTGVLNSYAIPDTSINLQLMLIGVLLKIFQNYL